MNKWDMSRRVARVQRKVDRFERKFGAAITCIESNALKAQYLQYKMDKKKVEAHLESMKNSKDPFVKEMALLEADTSQFSSCCKGKKIEVEA